MAKLLHILDSINPAFGGTVESVRQLVAGLSGTEHVVEVASLDAPSNPWTAAWQTKVYCLGPGVSFYRYASRLGPWLRRFAHEYDAVVVNGLWRYPTWAAYRALAGTGVPYFVTVHGMLDPWFNRQTAKYCRKWLFWKLLESQAVRHARAVIYTCAEEQRLAKVSFSPYRCRRELVLSLGVAQPPERRFKTGGFLKKHPVLAEGGRYMLFLGRIHPKKGCDILLRAFARCARSAPDCRVVIAGPDGCGWIPQLKKIAADLGIAGRVVWAGPLYGEAKWEALSHADAFALPSHQEAFPVAVLEALACGVPVLTTRNVNIWREIIEADAGLAGDDTVDSAAAVYDAWLQKPDAGRAAMRRNAARLFQERYLSSKAALEHVQAIQSCL